MVRGFDYVAHGRANSEIGSCLENERSGIIGGEYLLFSGFYIEDNDLTVLFTPGNMHKTLNLLFAYIYIRLTLHKITRLKDLRRR